MSIAISMRMVAQLLAAAAVLAGALLVAAPVRANGVPQLVELKYLPGLSNYGPQTAEGVAEFSYSEGYLVLEATGLEPLAGAYYQVWLVRSTVNDALSIGTFNAAADGSVHFSTQLPPIVDYSYDLIILTIEADPDDSPVARDERSIGGFFTAVAPADVSPPAADTQRAAGAGGATLGGPATLPDTGDADYLDAVRRGMFAGGGLAAAMGIVGISIARRGKGKKGASQ